MASGNPIRTRADRVAALSIGSGQWRRVWRQLQRGDVLVRIGMCVLAVLLLWIATRGWAPAFSYRSGAIPGRNITASVRFTVRDDERTRQRKERAAHESLGYYQNDPTPLRDLRLQLIARLDKLVTTEPVEQLPEELLHEFFLPRDGALAGPEEGLQKLRAAIPDAESRRQLDRAITELLADSERLGLLEGLDERHKGDPIPQTELRVFPVGQSQQSQLVPLKSVRMADVRASLERRLAELLRTASFPDGAVEALAPLLAGWLRERIRPTLKYDVEVSRQARDDAVSAIEAKPDEITYEPGQSTLVEGGHPIDFSELQLLLHEHDAIVSQQTFGQRLGRSAAFFGIHVALCILCGLYTYYLDPNLLSDFERFTTLLIAIVVTILGSWITAHDQWRAEIVPLTLFSMTTAIVYRRELALLLSAAVALLVTMVLGHGLAQFIVTVATISAAVLLLGRVRGRTKLMYVGLAVSTVCMLVSLCVCGLTGEAYGAPQLLRVPVGETALAGGSHYLASLLSGAIWTAICALAASVFMTGILPFIERLFDVQTDISLLELGDARHPLLQELVRRAPGTYNHSINVASIGEAAAEAIGANGLLVRVGAYFHDIGKMLKAQYFVENQGQETSRHLSLAPAMSTLVIIAHVKDGANLARQHHLPQSIIDFIEQHHGTTLVEYFYRQAAKQFELDPDGSEVDESHFRYPGPKPQTKETGVLMLSDAVESASRTLVDPTPSRIENLVHDLTMKRLLDGQFSDCGLTLQELHTIEQSLIKSLTAVYHGRVKYPDQQPA